MKAEKITQMSALCIAQPWATCIFEYGKNVENNSRNINKRGTIAIYASSSYVKGRFEACDEMYDVQLDFDELTKGAILGFADVVDVLQPNQKNVPSKYKKWWQPNSFGLILENITMLKKPVLVKPPNGAVKFWFLKGKELEEALKQLPASRIAKFIEW